MFVDLYAGTLSGASGAAQVTYSISGLYSQNLSFNVYGWCLSSNVGEGINWTNATDGTTPSSYLIESTAAVPIPAAFWLLSSGLAGVGLVRRRHFTVHDSRSAA